MILVLYYTKSYCQVPLSNREVKEVPWSLSKYQANSIILLPLCHCTDIFSITGAADQLRDTQCCRTSQRNWRARQKQNGEADWQMRVFK